jgi:hypothetical protein
MGKRIVRWGFPGGQLWRYYAFPWCLFLAILA